MEKFIYLFLHILPNEKKRLFSSLGFTRLVLLFYTCGIRSIWQDVGIRTRNAATASWCADHWAPQSLLDVVSPYSLSYCCRVSSSRQSWGAYWPSSPPPPASSWPPSPSTQVTESLNICFSWLLVTLKLFLFLSV